MKRFLIPFAVALLALAGARFLLRSARAKELPVSAVDEFRKNAVI